MSEDWINATIRERANDKNKEIRDTGEMLPVNNLKVKKRMFL